MAQSNPYVVLSGVNYTVTSNGRGTTFTTAGRTYTFVFYLARPVGTQPPCFRKPIQVIRTLPVTAHSRSSKTRRLLCRKLPGPTLSKQMVFPALQRKQSSGNSLRMFLAASPPEAIDINTAGNTASAVAITPATNSFSTSSSAERGTLALTLGNPLNQTRNFAVYVVSPTQVFLVEIDSGQLAAGALLRQF